MMICIKHLTREDYYVYSVFYRYYRTFKLGQCFARRQLLLGILRYGDAFRWHTPDLQIKDRQRHWR